MVAVGVGIGGERAQPRLAALGRGQAVFDGDRQHAAVGGGEDRARGGQRLEPAGDVGAVWHADPGGAEQQRQAVADLDVAAGGGDRAERHAGELVHRPQRRRHATGAQVVVLHDEMAAGGDPVPQPRQRGDRVSEVEQQQAGVDEIECSAGGRSLPLDVDGLEAAVQMPGGVQHRERLSAERCVDVDAEDAAARPNALSDQPHRLARAAARVQATRPRRELDPVEQPPGRGIPDARLGPQPLVLGGSAAQHVAIRRSGRVHAHGRDRGRSRPAAHRGRDHDLSRGGWRGRLARRRVASMPDALLDRDAELAALERQLAVVRAGSGRVIVVEGPAGIGKSSLLAAVASGAEAGGVAVLRARGGPLEYDAAWGIARELFAPLRASAAWSELAVGAAALARRALDADADAAEPANAGDAMHAAAHGLTWLASNLADRSPALLVVDDVHWADAPSLRWLAQLARRLDGLALGVLCAIRAGEPAAAPDLLAELLAAAPEPPLRPRPLGPAAAEALVAERLPGAEATFAHACHAVTGGNPFLLGALLAHLAGEGVAPKPEVAARLSAFGPEQVARNVERQLARLPTGAAALARAFAVLGQRAPLRHACRLAEIDPATGARLADRLRAIGLLAGDRDRLALVHPLIASALAASLQPGERSLWHARAARLLERERADPETVALHLLHAEPAAEPATVAVLCAAADRAEARGAPESAAAFLRRALAEPPPDRAGEAAVRAGLGLALAANLHPDAPRLLAEAVADATPAQRGELALRGARALALDGHFDHALDLCRRALTEPAGTPPDTLARLDAELTANAWASATTIAEARERVRRPPADTTLQLWRLNAAMRATLTGEPADATLALVWPALDSGALDAEPDTALRIIALFTLIANDQLATAIAACDTVIDAARPRGWLIALAMASHMRAMALVPAGRIRDAELDARLGFDYKLAAAPIDVVLWPLHTLVDALVELDELDDAEAALAAAGQQGDPPAGAAGAPLLLQSRARLRLAQHRHEDALADARAAAARWAELGVGHPGVAGWRVDAADALVALGDPVSRPRARRRAPRARRPARPARPDRRRAARPRPRRFTGRADRPARTCRRPAGGQSQPARAHPRTRRPRRRAAPREPPRRRPGAAAPRA